MYIYIIFNIIQCFIYIHIMEIYIYYKYIHQVQKYGMLDYTQNIFFNLFYFGLNPFNCLCRIKKFVTERGLQTVSTTSIPKPSNSAACQ